ncbi:hypothetical protein [uncultured Roseibium sp.]|uniref:hypothetical protein n=1 Tax=uncultured Roseibium sp. TaxID=1936171 RepID=UPI0026326D80|nr:hypothetical protein [uncultured Roseibium sp.]
MAKSNEIIRKAMFPYGMSKNEDGSWTLFNRDYKPLGVVSKDWEDWDDERHKVRLNGLGPATLAKLGVPGNVIPNRVYFYEDASVPTRSKKNMDEYFEKLKILIRLTEA